MCVYVLNLIVLNNWIQPLNRLLFTAVHLLRIQGFSTEGYCELTLLILSCTVTKYLHERRTSAARGRRQRGLVAGTGLCSSLSDDDGSGGDRRRVNIYIYPRLYLIQHRGYRFSDWRAGEGGRCTVTRAVLTERPLPSPFLPAPLQPVRAGDHPTIETMKPLAHVSLSATYSFIIKFQGIFQLLFSYRL